jgi:hypothetical protein
MLTAIAGVIAAITGLLTLLYQAGVIGNKSPTLPAATSSLATDTNGPSVTTPTDTPPDAGQTKPAAQSVGRSLNLLSSENGGHLVVTSGDDWQGTIDGKEAFNQISYGLTDQNFAVFAFRGDKPARFDRFTMLINATANNNVKEFELLAGNDSPTGSFEPIGKFTTKNYKLVQTPYQEFSFPAVRAKYLKVRLLSTYGFTHPNVQEIQLFGQVEN